jgi:hypothetical protein
MNSEIDKAKIYLALGTNDAIRRGLPMEGATSAETFPDLAGELAALKSPKGRKDQAKAGKEIAQRMREVAQQEAKRPIP